jgi:hypothetical protein
MNKARKELLVLRYCREWLSYTNQPGAQFQRTQTYRKKKNLSRDKRAGGNPQDPVAHWCQLGSCGERPRSLGRAAEGRSPTRSSKPVPQRCAIGGGVGAPMAVMGVTGKHFPKSAPWHRGLCDGARRPGRRARDLLLPPLRAPVPGSGRGRTFRLQRTRRAPVFTPSDWHPGQREERKGAPERNSLGGNRLTSCCNTPRGRSSCPPAPLTLLPQSLLVFLWFYPSFSDSGSSWPIGPPGKLFPFILWCGAEERLQLPGDYAAGSSRDERERI